MTNVIDLASRHAAAPLAGRAREVDRPRLDLLSEIAGPRPGVIALLAPAGFGKTVLMRQWQRRERASHRPEAWLSLTEADRREGALAQRLTALGPQGLLFLDDTDVLRWSAGEGALRDFLAAPPEGLTVVLAGRAGPALPLARMKLDGVAISLDASQLAMDVEEVGELLAEPRASARDTAVKLMRATAGWPAAVALAARELAAGDPGASRMLARLPLPWPALRRYLEEEIIAPLPGELADFLAMAGAMGRFSVAFAQAVLGFPDAARQVTRLQALGLPVGQDADDPSLQVVHPLFAAFLEERARASDPDRFLGAHRAAAHWYAEQGLLSDAVRSAFASNDGAFAGELLARASAERRRIGRFRTFAGWSARLPDAVFERYPTLRLEAACAHAALFEHEAARLYADPVRLRYDDLSPVARDDLQAVDAIIAIYADRPDAALEAGLRGLKTCAGGDPYTLGTLRLATAFGWIAKGAHDAARQALVKARADHDQARSAFGTTCALALSGLSHATQGRLPAAVADWKAAEQAISTLENVETVQSIAIGYLPETLYEWNDLEGAEERLRVCLASSMEVALPDMVTSLFLTGARVAAARGDLDRASEVLGAAEVAGLRRGWPRLTHAVAWERIRLALAQGQVADARRLHEELRAGGDFVEIEGFQPHATETEASAIGALRLELVTAPSRGLVTRIRAAAGRAALQGRVWRQLRLLVLEARAQDALDNRPAALRALRRALELGAPGRFVRSFVDEGPQVLRMVAAIHSEERRAPMALPLAYLETLLAAGGVAPLADGASATTLEPLSRREQDVVRMLAAGLSNAEIGARLFVSQHTVKWHLQHIYEKLQVKSRLQAAAAAKAAGLI